MRNNKYDSLSFSYKGERDDNEDYILKKELKDRGCFIVCDGVGGAQYGEIASKLAAESFVSYVEKNQNVPVDKQFINLAIESVEKSFDDYFYWHSEKEGMATTMALLLYGRDSLYAAHIGDSRLYHIRDGKILFRTRDHSLFNQLLDNGLLSDDEISEMKDKKNILARAMQGKKAQSTRATVTPIEDVQKGDFFFLCSDGVNESVSDQQLVDIISEDNSIQKKIEEIVKMCALNSYDNYSGHLILVR